MSQQLPPQYTTQLYNVELPFRYKAQLSTSLEFSPREDISVIDYTSSNALEHVFDDISLPTDDFYTALNVSLSEAATYLRNGECISFPTETVYGLGANACDTTAVSKIYQAKGRPSDNPLIVHIATLDQLKALTPEPISPLAIALIHHFWPGPLSIILPHKNTVSSKVTAGLSSLAIRMPNHPIALGLIKLSDCPIAAPSSNTSGKPSPTEAQHVMYDLKGKIPGIVDGQVRLYDNDDVNNNEIINLDCIFGLESTVVDISHIPQDFDFTHIFTRKSTDTSHNIGQNDQSHQIVEENDQISPKQPLIYILRPGAITKQMLEGIVGGEGYVEYDPALLINVESFQEHSSVLINDTKKEKSEKNEKNEKNENNQKDDNIDGVYAQYDTKHHDLQPKCPGMKYTHYAPKAPVYIATNIDILTANLISSIHKNENQSLQQHEDEQKNVQNDNNNNNNITTPKIGLLCTSETLTDIKQHLASYYAQNNQIDDEYINKIFDQYIIVKVCGSKDNMHTIASKLYKCLRDFDQIEQVTMIYAELLSHNNLGAAIMDRLLKAAGGKLLR